jgi:asparagine synthase (glutamine-hydrolysing)
MCGIAGFINTSIASQELDTIAGRMVGALRHRGPDDQGVWHDSIAGLALAHRRLTILDLSTAGHQPMVSKSGRFVIVFNGEIYNHLELRAKLAEAQGGMTWQGHSDTETILACCEAWDFEKTIPQLVGMFALALWDKQLRTLTLARDRLGEKPLYYGWHRNNFMFGSELKALASHPDWQGEVDRDALSLFIQRGYVPTPLSIWVGVHKLLPGSYLVIPGSDGDRLKEVKPIVYWSARTYVDQPDTVYEQDSQAIDTLEGLLRRSLAGQMIADVPLGAFLSGGVDSSTVVALMQAEGTRPVKTFTIGYGEKDYNEAVYAAAVAKHLGTDHTELYVTPEDAIGLIPQLADIYDEPFADASQLPTSLVAALARTQVTVSLSGDGGDELFGGYNRHVLGPKLWSALKVMPKTVREAASAVLSNFSPASWDKANQYLRINQPMFGDKVHKLAGLLGAKSSNDIYKLLISVEANTQSLLCYSADHSKDVATWADDEMKALQSKDIRQRMMFNDLVGYMTDDILCKVDRAAMAVSLETRAPLLDHRIVEFALGLPDHMKIRDGSGKWLLRQVLYRHVPKHLIERPKQGFGVPIDSWLRGPLRQWTENLLNPARLDKEGFFNSVIVTQKWQEHASGKKNWQYWLWNILMFQAWQEKWLNNS